MEARTSLAHVVFTMPTRVLAHSRWSIKTPVMEEPVLYDSDASSGCFTADINMTLESNYPLIKNKYPMINHYGKEYLKKRMYMCITESLCCTTGVNLVKHLYFNKNNKLRKIKN